MTISELEKAIANPNKFIIRYRDPEYVKSNPKVAAHMYIIIPYNDDNMLLLNMITSSLFAKRTNNQAYLECIIDIKAGDYDFITKDCIIDCNQCFLKSKNELIDNATLQECDEMSQNFLNELKNRIKQSPVVKKKIKKHIL